MKRLEKRESTLKGDNSSIESVIDAKSMISNDTSEVTLRKKPKKDEYTSYIVNHKVLPEVDTSILELKDILKEQPYYSKVTDKLIDSLSTGIAPEEAIKIVSDKLNISYKAVKDNYFFLKDTLKKLYNY